jgi:subtilisin family serine protease
VRRLTVLVASLAAIIALLVASAGAGAAAAPKSYLIVTSGGVPTAAQVAGVGGQLTSTIPQVGVAVASSADANFKAKASKLGTVLPNLTLDWIGPEERMVGPDFGYPPVSGDNDPLFNLQWGHTAVDAVGAWNAGHFGDGVRVAILDSGVDADHPDLAPQVNVGLSTSFVPGESFNPAPGFYFDHGTHVAGTVAAADNAFGVIGVASQAELVGVQVLSRVTGSGSFDQVIQGIVYAADIDADVINMSLGGALVKSGSDDPADPYTAKEAAEIKNALGRATTYAYQNGTTVIASAGNDAIDADHTANLIHLPSDAPHVITISATAPVGWATDPANTFLDTPATYTNFGQSTIEFAAPGGDAAYPGNENCTVSGLTRPCWVFDLVFSTIPGGWAWAGGTSMAAPHASGVAAIIIGANGGSMSPSHVEAALRASADDLGKPGNDDFYGAGRVNAANAVGG